MLDRALEDPNIDIKLATKIEAIVGDDCVKGVDLVDVATGDKSCLPVEGVCIRIGMIPNTEFVRNVLPLNPIGQIQVDENMATEIPGVYAAGDARASSPMQMATAVGDGVVAAMALGRWLQAN